MVSKRNGLPAFKEQDAASDDDDDDIAEVGESDETSSGEDLRLTSGKGKLESKKNQNIIVQTSFDSYFVHNKPGRPQTSSSVFSELVPPLSADEYLKAIGTSGKGRTVEASILEDKNRDEMFVRFMYELREGFNIICYGLGSKRQILNRFAKDVCAKQGHVVVINGFLPEASLKDALNSIENIPDLEDLKLSATTVEKQAKRVHDFFVSSRVDLYLIVHNIDGPPFRTPKSRSILSFLANNPKIHLIASIDHINAPLLWPSSESFFRKPQEEAQNNNNNDDDNNDVDIHTLGFAWLWHDLTTLASYDFELAYADRTSLSGAHYGGGSGGAKRKGDMVTNNQNAMMNETAATHILASVTQKAQKLFVLLGTQQLEGVLDNGTVAEGSSQQVGLAYDVLFSAARNSFIATNDTAFRALLTEFRDHNLIVSSQQGMGGGEVLWIPMRKERLANVLQSFNVPGDQ